MGYPQYTKLERKKIRSRIRELKEEDGSRTHHQIAEILNSEGFRTPQGLPIKFSSVAGQSNAMGLRKFSRKSRRGPKPLSPKKERLDINFNADDKTAVLSIIKSAMSDAKKIKIIEAILL